MQKITLYYRPFCPYCGKVIAYMKKNNISIPMKNVSQSYEDLQELKTIGGKTQVPCLVINGKPLYESDDIIQWLGDNMGK